MFQVVRLAIASYVWLDDDDVCLRSFRVLCLVSLLGVPSDGWLTARNEVYLDPKLNLDHND